MSCTILCKLLDELAENTPRAQVKMSGRAGQWPGVTCCATFCRAGPGLQTLQTAAWSVWSGQSRRRALCTLLASHHSCSSAGLWLVLSIWCAALIGCWGHCWLHLSGSAQCRAQPGPVLCFAKQKTCPCQSLDNSSAPTNRRLKDSSMDKLEAHNGAQGVQKRLQKSPCHT